MAAQKSITVSEEKIREIAHQLWIEAGQPSGQAEDHWFKALELASAKAAKKSAAKAKPVVKAKPAAKPAAKKVPIKKAK
jgi:septal ring-binding cell division protein DamX